MLSFRLVKAATVSKALSHHHIFSKGLLSPRVAITQLKSNIYTKPQQPKDVQMDKETVMVRIYEPGIALPHQQWVSYKHR